MTLSGKYHDIICVIDDIIRNMSWHHMCYRWYHQENVMTSYVLYMTSSGKCHDIICVIDDIIRKLSWHHMYYRWHHQENVMTSHMIYITSSGKYHYIFCYWLRRTHNTGIFFLLMRCVCELNKAISKLYFNSPTPPLNNHIYGPFYM